MKNGDRRLRNRSTCKRVEIEPLDTSLSKTNCQIESRTSIVLIKYTARSESRSMSESLTGTKNS